MANKKLPVAKQTIRSVQDMLREIEKLKKANKKLKKLLDDIFIMLGKKN